MRAALARRRLSGEEEWDEEKNKVGWRREPAVSEERGHLVSVVRNRRRKSPPFYEFLGPFGPIGCGANCRRLFQDGDAQGTGRLGQRCSCAISYKGVHHSSLLLSWPPSTPCCLRFAGRPCLLGPRSLAFVIFFFFFSSSFLLFPLLPPSAIPPSVNSTVHTPLS